ncbi:MAG: entericidin A/B family lipoprotein [Burkholderiales bacterium]|nr:entericidin A/B family lipoprotein [Burkholderiales bacterium]
MRRLLVLAMLAAVLAGCNTMSGIGKDIEAAGEGIQRASGKK